MSQINSERLSEILENFFNEVQCYVEEKHENKKYCENETIENIIDDEDEQIDFMESEITSFQAAGVLTDEGLIIGFDDGREFQITIKQSKGFNSE